MGRLRLDQQLGQSSQRDCHCLGMGDIGVDTTEAFAQCLFSQKDVGDQADEFGSPAALPYSCFGNQVTRSGTAPGIPPIARTCYAL